MGRGSITGRCNVCGAFGKLTFEHVPPRSAYNSERAQMYDYGEWLSLASTGRGRYEQQQRGSGYYALCNVCNNVRGGDWYIPEYELWVAAGAEIISALDVPPPSNTVVNATFHAVRPALF